MTSAVLFWASVFGDTVPPCRAGKYSRFMPGYNFPSHNIEGCGNAISHFPGTAEDCQAACDSLKSCDMWTFCSGHGRDDPVPRPWCCLKGCWSNASGLADCPPPIREANTTSGVKNVTAYGVRPPPPPCKGNTCFQFTFDEASGNASTSFPTLGRFGVRKVEAIVHSGITYVP